MTLLITNKRARFDFEVLEEFDVGVELLGMEVKSVRQKKGKLEGGRIVVRGGEAFLVGVSIPPYQPSNTPKSYDPERPRRLLLTKKEIAAIAGAESKKGLTIVPLSCYNKNRLLKLQIAIVRGKKKADKREAIKERESKREAERLLKRGSIGI
jgi:SsrA-binding protein